MARERRKREDYFLKCQRCQESKFFVRVVALTEEKDLQTGMIRLVCVECQHVADDDIFVSKNDVPADPTQSLEEKLSPLRRSL